MNNIVLKPTLLVFFEDSKKTIKFRAIEPPVYSESRKESDAGILLKNSIKAIFRSDDVELLRNSTCKVSVLSVSNSGNEYRIGNDPYLASISISGGIPYVTITFEASNPIL